MNYYRVEPWRAELYHFNPNHDPRTGQFTSKNGIGGRITSTFKSGTSKARSLGSRIADYRERRRAAKRRSVIQSGSAEEIRKFQKKHGGLTQAEFKEAYDRIDWEQRLNDLDRANSVKRAQDNALRLTETIKIGAALATQIKEMGTRTVDAYNFAADVYNAMSTNGKKWKKIEFDKKASTPLSDNAAVQIMKEIQGMNKEQLDSYIHSGKAKKASQFVEEIKKVETAAGDKFQFDPSLFGKSSNSGKTEQANGSKTSSQNDNKQQSGTKKETAQNGSESKKNVSDYDNFWKDIGLNSSNVSRTVSDYEKDVDSYFASAGSTKVSEAPKETVDAGRSYVERHYTELSSYDSHITPGVDKNAEWLIKSQNPRLASVRHSGLGLYLGGGLYGVVTDATYLFHTGIKGQRWGSRRFRGYDGKLTPLGKQRYQKGLYTNYGYDSGSPPDGVYAYNKEEDEVYESVGGIMVAIDHERPDYEEKKAEARRAMEMQEELKRAMSHTAYLGGGIYGVVSDETYLAHHGVKGMHWGVRRYQPYPDGKSGKFVGKRELSRALKKTEAQYQKDAYRHAKLTKRVDKLTRKQNKRGLSERETAKLSDLKNKQSEAARYMKKGESDTWKLIGDATKAGYDVTIKHKQKLRVTGKNVAIALLTGGHLLTAERYTSNNYKLTTTHNKNKEMKQVESNINSHKTETAYEKAMVRAARKSRPVGSIRSDSKQTAYQRAKNENLFSGDFLEATQNDNYSDEKMLTEYKKYLEDPSKYMRTH